MSESSLTLSLTQIQRNVCRFLGWDSSSLTATETTALGDAIDAGLRQFYVPPVLPREKTGHRWSWLRPTLSIATVSGTSDYDLPDLFGGFVGQLAFASGDNVPYRHLKMTGYAEILQKRAELVNDLTVAPLYFATYPSTSTLAGSGGQRFKIALWPTPGAAYTLTGQYFINPFQMDSTHTYHLGGQPHSQTLLASCLATADKQMNQNVGMAYSDFLQLLATSVSFDRATTGTQHFGQNLDRSGNWNGRIERQPTGSLIGTYNGTDYSH